MGSKAINNYDTKIAMIHVLKSHSELHKVMLPVLLDKHSLFEMVEHLQRRDTIMGANKLRRKQIRNLASKARITTSRELDRLNNQSDGRTDCSTNCHSSNSQVWTSKESTAKCHQCGIVGHYANNCTQKANRSVNHLELYSGSDASSHSSDEDSLKDQAEEE